MRVLVRHGHFAFYPRDNKDVVKFQLLHGQTLERDPAHDFFTFPNLVGVPRYSIAGMPFGTLPAVLPALYTYEGLAPWDVMRKNQFVYDVTTSLLIPALSVTHMVKLTSTYYYATASTLLIQPGGVLLNGSRILSYDAEFMEDWQRLRVRSVGNE